jgi:hypothetical protein
VREFRVTCIQLEGDGKFNAHYEHILHPPPENHYCNVSFLSVACKILQLSWDVEEI